MSRVGLAFVAFLVLAGGCGGGGGSDTAATSVAPAVTVDQLAVAEGTRLFEGTCAACHGFDAMGIEGLGRPLVDSVFVAERANDEMVAFLIEGRKADHPDNITGVDMPPRGGNDNLSDRDLSDIVSYVRTLGSQA